MKTALCTISTKSHIFKSKVALESVAPYSETDTVCLLTDTNQVEASDTIKFYYTSDLKSKIAQQLLQKYKGDQLRWSLKPIFTKFLLENGYDQVIYVDNDIFFYSSPDFLFEKLKKSSFLLTPHFYKADPNKNQNWLEANYRVGLYNAGFFGVNKDAIPILDWWAECCLYNVRKSFWRGLYDDQKYLDLVPVIFDNTELIKHRGCNFAGWNCDGVLLDFNNNQLFVNNDQLLFIHFAQISIERFSKVDSPMHAIYKEYLEILRKYKSNFEFQSKERSLSALSAYIYYLRWKCTRLFERSKYGK